MHAQEGGCLNIVPSTLYQQACIAIYFLVRARSSLLYYIYCDERQMSKARRRERKKDSVSLDGQPTKDDNDSKRLGRFCLKKYLFPRPSRDHLIARGVSWFFLYLAAVARGGGGGGVFIVQLCQVYFITACDWEGFLSSLLKYAVRLKDLLRS